MPKQRSLIPYIWLSISAAIITISLKTSAYFVTGSVGLLSDALESIINLVAAISALFFLKLAEKPPDEDHVYGHSKAEYFSSLIEAALIIFAAVSIGSAAIGRIINPQELKMVSWGLIISAIASIINLLVALILLRIGTKYKSITLKGDGHHLLTDVWTSVGVIIGVGLVSITNLHILDPIVAIFVAINIIVTGYRLLKESALGLMDTGLPSIELNQIKKILLEYEKKGATFHGLKTRQSATRSFMSVHILVPGVWTVQKGHDLLEDIEKDICNLFPHMSVFTHLEPIEDPKSMEDREN
ncbi:MAG TPA: cation diffusion facilitator family transporter [Candidatus Woesebacteria bacterium]|nr:cation diffusion facilitator family transporter [Candidatus Woesebacteria bacterium]